MYTHCAGHNLDLTIVTSCSILPIQRYISQVKSMTHWIKASSKREGLLESVVLECIQSIMYPNFECLHYKVGGKYRWMWAILSLLFLSDSILWGIHPWYIRRVIGHKKTKQCSCTSKGYKFIYVLVTLQCSLLYLKEVSVKLQGINQDIVFGLNLIDRCCCELKSFRRNVFDYSAHIYAHSFKIFLNRFRGLIRTMLLFFFC